jgi:hypothetical protein
MDLESLSWLLWGYLVAHPVGVMEALSVASRKTPQAAGRQVGSIKRFGLSPKTGAFLSLSETLA